MINYLPNSNRTLIDIIQIITNSDRRLDGYRFKRQ